MLEIKADNPEATIFFTKTYFDYSNTTPVLPDLTDPNGERYEYQSDYASHTDPRWIGSNCIIQAVSYIGGKYSPVATAQFTRMNEITINNGKAIDNIIITVNDNLDYTGADMPLTLPRGSKINLDINGLTPEGYVFTGWQGAYDHADIKPEQEMNSSVRFDLRSDGKVYQPIYSLRINELCASFVAPVASETYSGPFPGEDNSGNNVQPVITIGTMKNGKFQELQEGEILESKTYSCKVGFMAGSDKLYFDPEGVTATINGQTFAANNIKNENTMLHVKSLWI